MKKFKYALWVLLIIFLGLVVWLNQGVFLATHDINLHLGFAQYELSGLYSIVIIAAIFFTGMLIAYATGLYKRYLAHMQIRSLKKSLNACSGTIDTLKQEVEGLKCGTQTEMVQSEMAAEPSTPPAVETANR